MKLSFKRFNPLHILKLPKKFLIPGVIILVGLIWFFVIPHGNKVQAQTVLVKYEDLKSTISASGVLTGKNSTNLRFKSGGKIAVLNVKETDTVTAGQTIASLDTQDLAIALQQAQNNLRDKQVQVEKIYDDIHLFQYGNGGTTGETEAQKQTRTTAEAARDSAVDQVKAAERAYQDAVIVTPISGTVTSVPVVAGQYVSATDTVATVVDWSGIYFDTDIDEADIAKVQVGQNAEINLNAYPDLNLDGTVEQILPETKTTTSGATVVTVKINLHNPQVQLINNLNGQASIITNQALHVLAVPQEAVTENNQVVVKNGPTYETRTVSTGLRSDTDIEITSGVKEGELVVTNPQSFINTGPKNSNPLSRIFRGVRVGR